MIEQNASLFTAVTPIDIGQVNFDVLGLSEVPATQGRGAACYMIEKSLTLDDIMIKIRELEKGNNGGISSRSWRLADIRAQTIRDAVEELRLLLCREFSRQLYFPDRLRPFFSIAEREKIVQIVKTPVSYVDTCPGDTQIKFMVFTERFLGTADEN